MIPQADSANVAASNVRITHACYVWMQVSVLWPLPSLCYVCVTPDNVAQVGALLTCYRYQQHACLKKHLAWHPLVSPQPNLAQSHARLWLAILTGVCTSRTAYVATQHPATHKPPKRPHISSSSGPGSSSSSSCFRLVERTTCSCCQNGCTTRAGRGEDLTARRSGSVAASGTHFHRPHHQRQRNRSGV